MKDIKEFLEETKNKKLLAIFAHPDDETMSCGGLLLTAKKLGYQTTVFTITKGGAGQMHIHPHGKTTKQVRTIELQRATSILGVNQLILDDFDDGKLQEQESDWSKVVKQIIEKVDPGIVVTWDPSGWTGHPDHIMTSIVTKDILSKKKEIALLWPVGNPEEKFWMNDEVRHIMPKPDFNLQLTKVIRMKLYRAASQYKSQRFSNKKFGQILRIVFHWKQEWYHMVDFQKEYKHKFVRFDI